MANIHKVVISDKSIGMMSNAEMSKWSDAFDKVKVEEADVIPAGWYTTVQLAKQFGMSASPAYNRVCKLMANGQLEMRKFKIKRTSRMFLTPHYKLKV